MVKLEYQLKCIVENKHTTHKLKLHVLCNLMKKCANQQFCDESELA